jgi:arsenate reductase
MSKRKVLILCTGNSCRSHMAEGILRHAADDLFEVHSAGSAPAGYVHPNAIAALKEIGIDISGHRSSPPNGNSTNNSKRFHESRQAIDESF